MVKVMYIVTMMLEVPSITLYNNNMMNKKYVLLEMSGNECRSLRALLMMHHHTQSVKWRLYNEIQPTIRPRVGNRIEHA